LICCSTLNNSHGRKEKNIGGKKEGKNKRKEGRKKGRKEERKKGRKEGRKEGIVAYSLIDV